MSELDAQQLDQPLDPADHPLMMDPEAGQEVAATAMVAETQDPVPAQVELPREGPPIQWGSPTQPHPSRPSTPQPSVPRSHALVSAPQEPGGHLAAQGTQTFDQQSPLHSGQWAQPAPAFQWPQQLPPQYAQPQAVQPQPKGYPAAYPAAYPTPLPAVYPVTYPQAQQAPQAAPSGQPYPAYPGYPAYPPVYPPMTPSGAPTPGTTGSWQYPQPTYAPGAYGHPAQTAIVESGRSGPTWQPEEKPKQAFIWRAIKWPLKTALKGLYLTGSAAKRHRAVALVLVVLIAMLVGGAYEVYQATNPAPPATGSSSATSSQPDITPFTIVAGSQPPLSAGVITFLHAYKSFDGYQLWGSLSPNLQQNLQANGLTVDQLNGDLQKEKQAGAAYTEFIYTGGFLSPDGTSQYTVEAVESVGSARAVRTWYFMTDQTDKIVVFQQLYPSSQGGQGG